jgi:hypothetical protein
MMSKNKTNRVFPELAHAPGKTHTQKKKHSSAKRQQCARQVEIFRPLREATNIKFQVFVMEITTTFKVLASAFICSSKDALKAVSESALTSPRERGREREKEREEAYS